MRACDSPCRHRSRCTLCSDVSGWHRQRSEQTGPRPHGAGPWALNGDADALPLLGRFSFYHQFTIGQLLTSRWLGRSNSSIHSVLCLLWFYGVPLKRLLCLLAAIRHFTLCAHFCLNRDCKCRFFKLFDWMPFAVSHWSNFELFVCPIDCSSRYSLFPFQIQQSVLSLESGLIHQKWFISLCLQVHALLMFTHWVTQGDRPAWVVFIEARSHVQGLASRYLIVIAANSKANHVLDRHFISGNFSTEWLTVNTHLNSYLVNRKAACISGTPFPLLKDLQLAGP